jgi:hypothetical protein
LFKNFNKDIKKAPSQEEAFKKYFEQRLESNFQGEVHVR